MILIDNEVFMLLRDCSKYLTPGFKDYVLREGFLGLASQPLFSHPSSLVKFLLIMEKPIYEHSIGVEQLSKLIRL